MIVLEYLYLIGTFISLSQLKVKLLFSICITIYFGIIDIGKYVIIYNICNTSPWFISAMNFFFKIKAPQARDL